MNFSLDSTQIELQDALRRYLRAEVAPIVDRYEAEGRMVPQKMVEAMRDFGLLGGLLPEENGGYDLPMTSYGMLIAEVARIWPSLRSIISTSNLAASVLT
ncbi:MAG: acyl-CoA dehydrogenase family protein, partial [Hyphomicrobiales bacterium]